MANSSEEKRARILDEKRNVTSRISDTCRFIGFGLLAVFYSVHVTAPDDFTKAVLSGNGAWLLWAMGTCAALAIAFDYFQYICGAMSVNDALKRPSLDFDNASLAYRGRVFFFYAKQWVAGAATIALLVIVLRT